LKPLPGSPRHAGGLDGVLEAATSDLEALVKGGADGAVVENFGDAPFYPDTVPPVTVAAMTVVSAVLRAQIPESFLFGISVLRNDAAAALSIAHAVGADWIRVNVHAGAAVTDQGLLTGKAHETIRLRKQLGTDVLVFADVAVKHGTPLAARPIEEEAQDLVERGAADGVLVTGPRTGAPVDREHLSAVRRAVPGVPVLAASGVDLDQARVLSPHCDGFVVGTYLKQNGQIDRPVDPERVRQLALLLRRGRT